MATLNGASALGIDDQIGSLLPEKQADIVAVDLSGIETQPIYNPLSQLIYATGRHQVTNVWIGGKQLLRDRALTTINREVVLTKARQWQERIEGELANR